MIMYIPTIEENYEYRMKNLIKKFVHDYELRDYKLKEVTNPEELQELLWNDYAKEFAHAVLQDMNDFSGYELFEIGE